MRNPLFCAVLSCLLVGCPAPGEEGPEKTGKTSEKTAKTGPVEEEDDEAPQIDQDVSQVKPGQKYYWEAAGPFARKATWTITEIVKNKEVRYDLVSVTTLEGMDEPTREGPSGKEQPLPAKPEGKTTEKTETLKIGDVEFKCTIYETEDGVKIWFADRFPFEIKREKGGKAWERGNLIKIEAAPTKPPRKTAK